MRPTISARNTRTSDAIRMHIESVCAKLDQFYDRIVECEVVIEKKNPLTSVEFIVKVPHQTLVASASTQDDNLYRAIDEAHARLETQLKKYHDKIVAHR